MLTPDLSERAIESWKQKLPADILEGLDVPGEQASEGSGELINALNSASSGDVFDLVKQYSNDARAFGRLRRMRFIGWVANQPDRSTLLKKFEEESGGEGGAENVGVLFLEDIRAYQKVLAVRAAKQITNESNVESVLDAAASIENDIAFSQGGV